MAAVAAFKFRLWLEQASCRWPQVGNGHRCSNTIKAGSAEEKVEAEKQVVSERLPTRQQLAAACNSSHHDIPSAWPKPLAPASASASASAPAALLVLIQFNNLFSPVLLFFRSPRHFFARFPSFPVSQFCPVFLCCAAALLLTAEVQRRPLRQWQWQRQRQRAATPAISANEIAFCVPQTLKEI